MTNKEKRELLDKLESGCWSALESIKSFGSDRVYIVRNLLYSIEIIKEMRSDYDEEEGE